MRFLPPDLNSSSVCKIVVDSFESVSPAIVGGVVCKPIFVVDLLLTDEIEGEEGQGGGCA